MKNWEETYEEDERTDDVWMDVLLSRDEQKVAPDGTPTQSAHPARFSPDDKFSKQRVALKKRFGLLPTQLPKPEL